MVDEYSEDEELTDLSKEKHQAISLEEMEEDDGDGSSSMKSLPRSVSLKCKGSEKNLPDPFPLPENFQYDVELALKSKKMTRETTKHFYSAVANSMLSFKRYPTREEYTRVAVEIIRKYPFLKPRTGTGSPTVCLLYTFFHFV